MDNLATSVLLSEQGYIDVLGAGRMWVGMNAYGSGVSGWIFTSGSIRHNVTGLELTSDGNLRLAGGRLMLSAGSIEANGIMIDARGNVILSGAVNNGELTVTDGNRDDYLAADGNDCWLDAMLCPPTVIIDCMVPRICLPCAYATHTAAGQDFPETVVEGYTRSAANHNGEEPLAVPAAGFFRQNLSDLRSLVGKRIRLLFGDNWQDDGFNGGVCSTLLVEDSPEMDIVPQNIHDIRENRDYSFSPSGNLTLRAWPADVKHAVPAHDHSISIAPGVYVTLECRQGQWQGHECIYWVRTDSGTMLAEQQNNQ